MRRQRQPLYIFLFLALLGLLVWVILAALDKGVHM
jgi:hypothetical protein